MKHDTTHNILGNYCWTCQTKTKAGVPGWKRSVKSDRHMPHTPWDANAEGGYCTGIVWANQDEYSNGKPCAICNTYCSRPVEESFMSGRDPYREIGMGVNN